MKEILTITGLCIVVFCGILVIVQVIFETSRIESKSLFLGGFTVGSLWSIALIKILEIIHRS